MAQESSQSDMTELDVTNKTKIYSGNALEMDVHQCPLAITVVLHIPSYMCVGGLSPLD